VRYLADTVLTCDEAGTVHSPGALDVEDGRVAWVGTAGEAPAVDALEVRDLGGLLMPGLVNAHCHTPMTLVRGAGDGLPLWRWLTEAMWPREGRMAPEDVWWGMTLGSAEMLQAGVTTSCEMYLHEESVVEAARASGARLVMTPGVVSALHPDDSGEGRAQDVVDFHARHHDPTGRITVGVAPHSAYDLGVDRVVELAELARSLDVVLHVHLAETAQESEGLEAEHGASVVRILADHGVFGGRVLAAHCVWVDDDDIGVLAAHDVAVAHCPVSNMKLGSGVAPVAAMLEAGVTVALGTDGPASNDTLDLWEEVKAAPLLARVTGLDATLLGPSTVLAMATRIGGRAVGLDDVGCLAAGWAADFQRLDLDHHAFVPVTEPSELLAHVAWAGTDRRVTDVWVAGEQVVADGVVLTVDEEQARAEVQQRAQRLAAE
jgi:5-methylthioadenosine/S-adenosylhomocysteine deaminase